MWRKQDQPRPSSAAPETGAAPVTEAARTPSTTANTSAQSPVTVLPGSRLTGSLRVKGEITGNEDLLIDAQVEGRVHLVGATVVVGSNGRVVANITATHITVEGDIEGNLQAAERVRIGATGKTNGSVNARRISVDDGAEIHGAVETLQDADVLRPLIPSAAPKAEDVAVPKPVPVATSLAKEPSAAA